MFQEALLFIGLRQHSWATIDCTGRSANATNRLNDALPSDRRGDIYAARGSLRGLALATALISSNMAAGAAADDATVSMDGVRVPLSDLMSPEAQACLRHLIVDRPFGAPVPDITTERARQDGIMRGFLERCAAATRWMSPSSGSAAWSPTW
jgi:hypothetical protein